MSAKTKPSRRLPVLLAVAALVLSVVLEVIHVRAYLDPTVASFCAVDARFNCDTVALSRASVLLNVPTAVWGIAVFSAMISAITTASGLFLPLAALAAIATSALLAYEIITIGALCVFCEGIHLLSLGLLVIAWRRRDPAAIKAILSAPKKLLSALILPVGLLVLVGLFAPPYWVMVSWKSGPRLATGVDDDGHGWIGAENPTMTIHEYIDYGCPHCAAAASRLRLIVGSNSSKIRLVRHHQPRMRCIGRVFVASRCKTARAAFCAQKQGHLWEMDDWLFRYAPGEPDVDLMAGAQEVGLDLEDFSACMTDMKTYEHLDTEVRAANKKKIRETPLYEVDGEVLTPKELALHLDKNL